MSGCGLRLLLAVASAAVLTACASDPRFVEPGESQQAVLSRMGVPTGRYALPASWPGAPAGAAERLQYSWQPVGQAVYNVDVDAAGRVLGVTQALDEGRFALIGVDRWTRDDVLREFGPPFEISGVHSFVGDIWAWRYKWGVTDRLLYIYLDPQGVVRRYHPADDVTQDWPLGR